MPFNQRDQSNINQSLQLLMGAVERWKRDKKSNDIMNDMRPPRAAAVDPYAEVADGYTTSGTKPFTGGEYGANLLNKLQDEELNREYKRAQITRTLREPVARAASRPVAPLVETPFGLMTPKDWAQEQRLRTKPHEDKNADSPQKLDRDLTNKIGYGLDALPDIARQGFDLVDAEGKYPEDEADGTHWRFKVPSGETVTLPKKELEPFARRALKFQSGFTGQNAYRRKLEGSSAAPTLEATPQVVKTQEERDALPPGTPYIAPDGSLRYKK